MNIFEKETGFIGDAPIEYLRKGLDEFWQQALSIRKRLGTKVYLFDNYLELLFESVNSSLAQDSSAEGLGKLSEQRNLFTEIYEGKTDSQNHPLNEKAKEYIENYPVDYQEPYTKCCLHTVGLVGELFVFSADNFFKNEEENFAVDIMKIKELYQKICILIGNEEQMQRLNFLFKQQFILATPMTMFLQGVINDFIFILMHRDDETHRLVFQLFLENLEEREVSKNEQ